MALYAGFICLLPWFYSFFIFIYDWIADRDHDLDPNSDSDLEFSRSQSFLGSTINIYVRWYKRHFRHVLVRVVERDWYVFKTLKRLRTENETRLELTRNAICINESIIAVLNPNNWSKLAIFRPIFFPLNKNSTFCSGSLITFFFQVLYEKIVFPIPSEQTD